MSFIYRGQRDGVPTQWCDNIGDVALPHAEPRDEFIEKAAALLHGGTFAARVVQGMQDAAVYRASKDTIIFATVSGGGESLRLRLRGFTVDSATGFCGNAIDLSALEERFSAIQQNKTRVVPTAEGPALLLNLKEGTWYQFQIAGR